jgi:hypothetical protein
MNNTAKFELNILRGVTLRYLGVPQDKADARATAAAEAAIAEVRAILETRYVFRFFDVEKRRGSIALSGASFEISGLDLLAHLENSKKVALFAATLGPAVDAKIREYMALRPSDALALDAAASAAVEALADRVQEIISETPEANGLFLTARFSPGYGDLPLELQPKILGVLDAQKKIGLTCTDSFILVPKKSVTAFIGIQKEPFKAKNSPCEKCKTADNCAFKSKGLPCGK